MLYFVSVVLVLDKMDTRNSADQLAFYQPSMLPLNVFPTEFDFAKCFLFEKVKWNTDNQAKKDTDNFLHNYFSNNRIVTCQYLSSFDYQCSILPQTKSTLKQKANIGYYPIFILHFTRTQTIQKIMLPDATICQKYLTNKQSGT